MQDKFASKLQAFLGLGLTAYSKQIGQPLRQLGNVELFEDLASLKVGDVVDVKFLASQHRQKGVSQYKFDQWIDAFIENGWLERNSTNVIVTTNGEHHFLEIMSFATKNKS